MTTSIEAWFHKHPVIGICLGFVVWFYIMKFWFWILCYLILQIDDTLPGQSYVPSAHSMSDWKKDNNK